MAILESMLVSGLVACDPQLLLLLPLLELLPVI